MGTLGFVSGLVRDYHAITAESDRETETLARVTAAVVAEDAAAHSFLDYGGAATFRAVDRRVATTMAQAALVFDGQDGRLLRNARTFWLDTYERLRLVTTDEETAEVYLAALDVPARNLLHGDLGTRQAQIQLALQRVDASVHREVSDGIGGARRVEHEVQALVAVLAVTTAAGMVLLARRLQRRVLSPVHALAETARRFGEGELDVRATVTQDDEIGRLASTFNEMADAVGAQQQVLRWQAYRDPLTGLTRGTSVAERAGVLFIDLDDFKVVNDSFGHAVGDQLLQLVADRLVHAVREGDVVARIGGDEFAVLLADPVEREVVLAIADRILAELTEPFLLDAGPVAIGASIGVALRHAGASDTDDMLRAADAVMYIAKGAGKNRVVLFDPYQHGELLTRAVTLDR